MFLKAFESISDEISNSDFLLFQMVKALDNPEMAKLIKEYDDKDMSIKERQDVFFTRIGIGKYVQHLISMKYVEPLKELKKAIEYYWEGNFVDTWGRKLDAQFQDNPEWEKMEKDFHAWLVWKFSNDEGTGVCDSATIDPHILSQWSICRNMEIAGNEALVKFFNPTIIKPNDEGEYEEMTDEEKQTMGLSEKIKNIEESFNLIQYYDFCVLGREIGLKKLDPKQLYDLI